MIEVFKTNISGIQSAKVVKEQLQFSFPGHEVNFDLDDCDHVLRVQCSEMIRTDALIQFISHLGFSAEVLPDEIPVVKELQGSH